MTILQDILAALNWNVRVNENFKAVSPAAAFGIKDSTTTGLTLGYYGGILDGVSYSDGTHALTASTTRYVVAARASGTVSSATGTTNWNDSTNYKRMGVAVVGSASITSWTDWREYGAGAGGGGGSVAGSDKQIQYNASGSFGAEAAFAYDYGTNTLTVDNITLNGLALTLASATGGAGFRLPHGAAPTSPTNGDMWTTTAGLYARINGATVGPYAAGMSNPMTTAGDIITGGSSGTPQRLAAGTNTYVLTMVSGAPAWAAAGGGGLTYFAESLNSSSPNTFTTISSLTAVGANAYAALALTPKGAGPLLMQVPDNSTTGGNARGNSAIDLQTKRGAASQVASAQDSVVIGQRNTASGTGAISIGDTNAVTSSAYGSAFGGFTNAVSGYAAVALGGSNNIADGNWSTALGGKWLYTRTIIGSTMFGAAASTLASSGKRQGELHAWAVQTSNNTATAMTTDGSASPSTANQLLLNDNSMVSVIGTVSARQGSTGDSSSWSFAACVKRGANAAATSVLGTPTVTVIGADSGASTWVVAIVADTTNGALRILVTGETSKTIVWTASAVASFVSA